MKRLIPMVAALLFIAAAWFYRVETLPIPATPVPKPLTTR